MRIRISATFFTMAFFLVPRGILADGGVDTASLMDLLREQTAPAACQLVSRWNEATGLREWIDATGAHRILATYVSHDHETKRVTLRTDGGRQTVVPLEKLSEKDRQLIVSLDQIQRDAAAFIKTLPQAGQAAGGEVATPLNDQLADAAPLGVGEPGESDKPRLWQSKIGNFSVQARFVSSDQLQVRLRRTDNDAILSVAMTALSDQDVAFIESLTRKVAAAPRPIIQVLTAVELATLASQMRKASDVLALYRAFLDSDIVRDVEKQKIRSRLAEWQEAATLGKIRFGRQWLRPTEAAALRQKEAQLFSEAETLYGRGLFEEAFAKFQEASITNPDDIQSDFRLGVIYALHCRFLDAEKASHYFKSCVDRRESDGDLNAAERMNLVASLNNLALAEVRLRQTERAIRYWSRALDLWQPTDEIVQNLGRMKYLARDADEARTGDMNLLYLDFRQGKKLRDVCERLGPRIDEFDQTRGWRYMKLTSQNSSTTPTGMPRVADTDGPPIGANLVLAAYGTGFVVHPNYILTNRHVVEQQDGFYIIEPNRPEARLWATVFAVSESDDLALLHCKTLQAAPVSLTTQPPRLSSELRLLGYPEPDELGSTLKVTSGIVSSIPPHGGMNAVLSDFEHCLLYDGVINHGNSGGPACNRRAEVVAVNTAILLPHAIGGGYAAGVTAEHARKFLQEALVDFSPTEPSPVAELDWETAVERVAASTVQIHCMTRPETFAVKDAELGDFAWDPYEDPWCMACYGKNMLPCPVQGCAHGGVLSYRWDTITFPDGAFVTKKVSFRVDCKTCKGKAFVSCRFCKNGLENNFVNAARQAWLNRYVKILIQLHQLGLLD